MEKYAESRAAFESIERSLPQESLPFVIRYGVAFSHLYEEHPTEAVTALEQYLAEYKDSAASQGFPEVFIWNSIARIHLENGGASKAMEAYEKGYESVPGSTLPEDQKQVWYGRLLHGKCRSLAKLGKHQEAWAEAEKVRKMIEEGGEAGEQYLPAYHYLAGYLKLESGEIDAAIEHLEKVEPGRSLPPAPSRARVRAEGGKGRRAKDVRTGGRFDGERARAGPLVLGSEKEARYALS